MSDDTDNQPSGAEPARDFGDPTQEPLESVIDRFELAWREGEPHLDAFLAARPGDAELALELCLVDLEYRRKRGRPADPTAYAERFPDPAVRERFLAEAAAAVARRRAVPARLVGESIGGVRLVRLVGEGGMGHVYEGLQDRPRRTVAVKVMKPGIASASLLKRFEHEAEVLARLRHPGIAQIHAVGTADVDGQTIPYFVMEYLPDAKPITAYAEERRLSTHERLELFRKVCDAVAHGHQKGVIHRDLKPGNVLVDAAGQPKVIDFGVARSTDADLALTTMQTDVGALIGTLQYMSPEQFDADPSDLDVRLDVYALGVILYELLAGQPPYDVRRKAIYEVARVVREVDPTPLSTVNRLLRRDVSVIAGKCLEKDRGRRYSSASELAADVGRYLAGEPIAAAPPGLWDGVARLARRHKAAAAAVAGVAVSLVAAVLGISAFAVRAERARVEADAAREAEAAQQAAADAESITAKRRLYLAKLLQLQAELEKPQRRLAGKLFRETADAYRDAYGPSAVEPVELALLRPFLDESLAVLDGHGGRVAYSPDGSRVATGSRDGPARLWDARTGKLLSVLEGHAGAITSVAFSPDGSRVATASADATARLWNATSGTSVMVLTGHQGPVIVVAFNHDGSRVATASDDATARIWDATTGETIAALKGHRRAVQGLAFSPDGSRLATAADDTTARLWKAKTGAPLAVFTTDHRGHSEGLAFSPDGTRLATVSSDATARLWDTVTGTATAVLTGHKLRVVSLAFGPDGSRLVTGSSDNTARLWDTATGRCLAILEGHEGPVTSVLFIADGTRVATASFDNSLRLWETPSGRELGVLHGHEDILRGMCSSPDGTRLATADNATVRLWNAARDDSSAVLRGHGNAVPRVAYSPDGRRLATTSVEATIRIWDTTTGDPLTVIEAKAPSVSVAYSPDGRWLAMGLLDGTVHVADAWTNAATSILRGHDKTVTEVTFSPDSRRVAAASVDATARIWDAATGAPIATLEGHEGIVESIAFSPDGTLVATAGYDGIFRLWNAETGALLKTVTVHGGPVMGVAFSPDGRRIATASNDKTARLWDVLTGQPLLTLDGHDGTVCSVAFSPDGARLATVSADRAVRLWNATNGEPVVILKGHDHLVRDVAFSPDGMRLATASYDKTVRLWGISNMEIHRNRIASAARRERLAPIVADWFTGDLAATRAKLEAAKATLSADDWHEAANLVLIRATTQRQIVAEPERRDPKPRAANDPGDLIRQGDAAKARRDFIGARRHYEEHLKLTEALAAENPRSVAMRRNVSSSLGRLGDLAHAAGDLEEAQDRYEKGLAVVGSCADDEPDNVGVQQSLAMCISKLGDVARDRKDFDTARGHYEKSLALYDTIAARDSKNTGSQWDRAVARGRLAELAKRQEKWAEALDWLSQKLDLSDGIFDESRATEKVKFQADMLRDIAGCHRKLGDNEAAAACDKRIAEIESAAKSGGVSPATENRPGSDRP